jgi:hypothetical protein
MKSVYVRPCVSRRDAASQSRNDACRHGAAEAERIAHRDDALADHQVRRRSDRRGGEVLPDVVSGKTQHREVAVGIDAENARELRAVVEVHGDARRASTT